MALAPDYVDLDDLKAYLRLGDTANDAVLSAAISAASRAIDRAARRQFGQDAAPVARVYTAEPIGGVWQVSIDDLMDADGVTVTVASGTITAYALGPANAVADGKPYTRLLVRSDSAVQPDGTPYGVTIIARWGWDAVPAAISQACMLQASRLFARRDSPMGVAGSPDLGNEMRLLAKLDPDVDVLVSSYRRMGRVG